MTNLNLQLLNTDDAAARQHILETIYDSEQQASSDSSWNRSAANPVDLRGLQHDLRSSELLLEYVLNEPQSYVLAITNVAVHRYTLPAKAVLERETKQYRSSILRQQADRDLAQQVFHDLLGAVPEYQQKQDVIVIPDGELHLLPFSALMDGKQYVLASHQVSVAPSGTVLDVLRRREGRIAVDDLPYLGVAAWTNTSRPQGFLATVFRAVSGPKRSELVALPASRYEVDRSRQTFLDQAPFFWVHPRRRRGSSIFPLANTTCFIWRCTGMPTWNILTGLPLCLRPRINPRMTAYSRCGRSEISLLTQT